MKNARSEIEAVLIRHAKAIRDKNAEALMACLTEGGCSGRMMDFSRISAKLTPLLGQVVGERSLGRLPG